MFQLVALVVLTPTMTTSSSGMAGLVELWLLAGPVAGGGGIMATLKLEELPHLFEQVNRSSASDGGTQYSMRAPLVSMATQTPILGRPCLEISTT